MELTGQPALRLTGVTKSLGRRTVLADLDLAVAPGEVFGILGPNGAGKTTAIRLMVGLIAPDAGDILIHGRSIRTEFTAAVSMVGAVVETPSFYGFMTGDQNLRHYLYLSRGAGAERPGKVASLLGMDAYIHRKVSTYSLGMRQRLGIAQALLHKPSVLILDEPTNGLDPAGIKELREHLRTLAERDGVAVVVSSHILAEMQLMCDRTAIIKEGRLLGVRDLRAADALGVVFTVDDPGRAAGLIAQDYPSLGITFRKDELEIGADRETAAALNARLVQAGFSVYAMRPKAETLEEIYISLTGGEGGA